MKQMEIIRSIILTDNIYSLLGQLCFVAIAMMIIRRRRSRNSISLPVGIATLLPVIMGIAAAYVQLQRARLVIASEDPLALDPDAVILTIYGLLGLGIIRSAILIVMSILFSVKKSGETGSLKNIKRELEIPGGLLVRNTPYE